MTAMQIRDATPADFTAILRLNDRSAAVLSPLDQPLLSHLHVQSAYHRVAVKGSDVYGFLLVLSESVNYDSPNYLWFSSRLNRFLYIDRVVVAEGARSLGIGSMLYMNLIAFAQAQDYQQIVCEYDIDPPNAPSAAFHGRLGFLEVARQKVQGGRKLVSLQCLTLDAGLE
jgi:uncharacterized protein